MRCDDQHLAGAWGKKHKRDFMKYIKYIPTNYDFNGTKSRSTIFSYPGQAIFGGNLHLEKPWMIRINGFPALFKHLVGLNNTTYHERPDRHGYVNLFGRDTPCLLFCVGLTYSIYIYV